MRNSHRFDALLLSLALALILFLGLFQPARAVDITVTTTADVLDAAGNCAAVTYHLLPGPDGVTSLREAMCVANNNTGPDAVAFDIPGCDSGCTIRPTIALPVLTDDETTIDGYTQAGASPATDAEPATLLIELDGSSIANNSGFNIISRGNVIRGLVINRFPWNGVAIGGSAATDNVISGNHIGTEPGGISSLGNGWDGVFVGLGAQRNTIGGDEPAERNIIAGNGLVGVGLHGGGTMSNTVSGNYVGVAADGEYDCANEVHGVHVYGGAQHNLVGSVAEGGRNVISGNTEDGVRIEGEETTGNVVQGNHIGVDATGTVAVPNRGSGVTIKDASENLVGGHIPGQRNIISGNADHGIFLDGGGSIEIVGNHIGLDAEGLVAVPNESYGIMIDSSENNTVGSEAEDGMNFISGNAYGIWIENTGAMGNRVLGNAIGFTVDGEPLGNFYDGVHLSIGAQQNTVGPRNWIGHNGEDGVGVDTPSAFGNVITLNYFFANGGLGIHLTNGANNGIAPPTILSASGGAGSIAGTACPDCTVEVFVSEDDEGEGLFWWGTAVASGAGDFAVPVEFLPYPYVAGTATDSDDGTSELSTVFIAESPVLHGSSKRVDRETISPGEVLTYTITLSNTGTSDAAATLTDTLPSEVTWADNASTTAGTLTWEGENNRLLWEGLVVKDSTVVITFQAKVNAGLSDGETIVNRAEVNDGAGYLFSRSSVDVTIIGDSSFLPILMR